MAGGGGHAADLAVFALGQFEGEPGVGDGFADANGRVAGRQGRRRIKPAGARGQRGVITDADAAGKLSERGIVGNAFDLHPVFAAVGVFGVEETGVETRFVGEKEEAFGVGVEATERVDVFGEVEVGERAPGGAGFGGELGKHAVGLVEGEEHRS